ncbi:MAG: site-specific DNA-methyltransferase [Bellilinea sp.]
MTDQPEKLDLRSLDLTEEKKQELLRLFPEIRTEGGKIDFEKLRLALDEAVDVGKERYGMNWPGKADCFRTIQAPSTGTLLPCPEESVNFDTTENLIIEGDNLEALKLLQKSYLGKVKMIYIDPPYNTGNDFIYPDNYSESLQTYLEYTGQIDSEGRKFGTNSDADGRFHSRWMNMMYPRLYLARNLLREDGAIFISIDDNEFVNLKKNCDEVFGEENFICAFVWKKRTGSNDSKRFYSSIDHEYILSYAKTSEFGFRGIEKKLLNYTNPDNDPRGAWARDNLTCNKTKDERPNLFYTITDPDTGITYECNPNRVWVYERERMARIILERKVIFPKNNEGTPTYKRHLSELRSNQKPLSSWVLTTNNDIDENDEEVLAMKFPINTIATKKLRDVMGDQVFDFPKSTEMLTQLIQQATDKNDIILDLVHWHNLFSKRIMTIRGLENLFWYSCLKFVTVIPLQQKQGMPL